MGIYRTHLYLLRFFHPFNPYNPCSFHHWVFCRTRIYRIDTDEIKYQYIKIQKYIFLCFFLIFIYWCFINVVLSSRQPFLLLVIIPRLRPGLLSLRSVLASSQILLAFYDKISIEKNNKKNREKYFGLFLFIDIFSTWQDNQTTNAAKLSDNPDPFNEKNKGKICKYRLLSVPLHPLFDRKAEGEMLEWLKRHAWKACIRQKRIGGSNPPLSAQNPVNRKICRTFI